MAKIPSLELNDAEQVALYMDTLKNPLKPEIEILREIILKSNKKISERIKWNAPSYYYVEDIVTFALHRSKTIILVFHHPAVVKIKSKLLEGDYKDRRLVNFYTMKEIKAAKKELTSIINELISKIEEKIK